MKVLFYSHNLWKISSTAKLSVDLANKLKEKYDLDIRFVISKKSDNDLEVNFPIYHLKRKGEIGKALGLKDLIQREKFDIVFSYMLTQNIILSLAKYFSKYKKTAFVGSVHYIDNYEKTNSWYKYPYRLLIKKLYSNLDKVVAVSNYVKEDLKRAFFLDDKKIEVIQNFIDLDRVKRLSAEPITEKEKNIFREDVIINVGRLEIEKGQIYLVRAFKKVNELRKNTKLVIIGDGSQREIIEAEVKKLNLENSVYLLGYKTNPYKYIKYSKLFVLPSLLEGSSIVGLEAQTLGLPVVAFNSEGGHLEVLGDSSLLVSPKDINGLSNSILKLLSDKKLYDRFKTLSLENVKNFSVDKKAEEYFQFFNKLVQLKNS
ncbi:MAG: hypothetical protein DSY66_05265 [Persephonella sp.]|nr:MAG: hypothetical protein DSY66_05265 [Persephonella sp.]